MVIELKETTIIADTKWEIINQNLTSKNYNISQADMYLLYAYDKKYQLANGNVPLVLLYPKHKCFDTVLAFEYENFLRINVVPFDFNFENRSFSLLITCEYEQPSTAEK